jgi:imidazolonepropionase-like amidohydrolase
LPSLIRQWPSTTRRCDAAALLKKFNTPVLGLSVTMARASVSPIPPYLTALPASLLRDTFTQPAEAYKAGVKFAFGTFNNEFVRNLPYQAATAVAFGLPYEEALKAVTINAAQIWGHGNDIGSVEKGKVADLMVTTGDPLEISTRVKYLFIKGKEIPLVNKQTRFYEKYMSRQ